MPKIFNVIIKLTEYSPLIKEGYNLNDDSQYENFNENCIYGEYFEQKGKNTFWANFGIAFSLYLTLTYLVYAIPTTLFDFSTIYSIKIVFWE